MSDGFLPSDLGGNPAAFAGLGFAFDDAVDGWRTVTYPPGWSWTWRDATTGRRAHAAVLDGRRRTRAMTMSAASGSFTVHLLPRFMVREVDVVSEPHRRCLPGSMLAIHDAGMPTGVQVRFDAHDAGSRLAASRDVEARLARLHPDNRDVLAYW